MKSDLKPYLKKKLTPSDIFFMLVNLVPLWGVWWDGWDAGQVFLVYCLESVIIGLYNVLMMLLTTWVKKKDLWTNGNYASMVSGYWFILFFIVHYGFFLAIQMGIFFSISGVSTAALTPGNFLYKIAHLNSQTSPAIWLLLLFTATHGLIILKDFILTGDYKKASLSALLFAPYIRVFVQQFCVILGSFFLQFGAGNIFIVIFVLVKMFFESALDYQRILVEAAEDQQNKLERGIK